MMIYTSCYLYLNQNPYLSKEPQSSRDQQLNQTKEVPNGRQGEVNVLLVAREKFTLNNLLVIIIKIVNKEKLKVPQYIEPRKLSEKQLYRHIFPGKS